MLEPADTTNLERHDIMGRITAATPKRRLEMLDGIPTRFKFTLNDTGVTCPCGWAKQLLGQSDAEALRFHYAHCAKAQLLCSCGECMHDRWYSVEDMGR